MKYALICLSLISFTCFSMQQPQALSKADVVDQMLGLKRADYEKMYDEVAALDLDAFSKTSAPWQMPASMGASVSIVDPQPVAFQQERSMLRVIAIKKECAPLIGYLLAHKKIVSDSDIARSMLLHAVTESAEHSVAQLLQWGVDPNKPSFLFFNDDKKSHSILLRALGYYVGNKGQTNLGIVRMLLQHKADPNENRKTLPLLQAVANYYHYGNRAHEILVIKELLAHRADPKLVAADSIWIGYLEQDGDYMHSAMEAATKLGLTELIELFELKKMN